MLHKSKQFLLPLIKILIIALCIYLLYQQWIDRPLQLETIIEHIKNLPWYCLPVLLSFSFMSWLVESKKWQYLVEDIELLRFRESVLQNLTAQAASFITPFRAGEFALKTLYFKKSDRKSIASRVLVGNTCQMIITLSLGIIGLGFYLNESLESLLLIFLVIGILLLMAVVFTLWVLKKWSHAALSKNLWGITLLFSLIRYVFFSVNWILLLHWLEYPETLWMIIRNITVMYVAVSILPVFQLFDIAVKWTVTSYVFTGALHHADVIMLTTTLIWMTNTLFPTLLGCMLLPFKNLKLHHS